MKSRLLYPCIVKKEDGIFYANFLDFEGCFTDGETLEEVVINAKDVLSGTLFTMAKHNIPFPSSENKKIDLKDGEFLIYWCLDFSNFRKGKKSIYKKNIDNS